MNIFTQIKNSIYNPHYYKSVVLHQPFRASLKYLAKVALLASLAGATLFAFSIPLFYKTLKTETAAAVATYPDDLIISIKNGTASVNKPEPYALKMLSSWSYLRDPKTSTEANMVVINTTKPFNLDDFHAYSTYALLTKTELVMMKNSSGELQIIPLSKLKNIEITKPLLLGMEAKLLRFLPAMMVLVLICVYIGFFIVNFVGTLIMLLLYACFILLLAKLKGKELLYKKSYQVGLHASTVLILLNILGLFISALGPFFIKLVAILLVVYINLFPDSQKEIKTDSTA